MSALSLIHGLYGMADGDFRPELPIDEKVAALVDGGVSVLQLRMKRAPARELWRATRAALERAGERVLVVVNDRPDVALAAGASAVHVGDDELPIREVRRLVGAKMILGASARTLEEALAADRDGADYIGFGPVWPTASKSDAAAAAGVEVLAEVVRRVHVPVVAIGGITLERTAQVVGAGAVAAAVISDVLGADDIAARVRLFAAAFGRG